MSRVLPLVISVVFFVLSPGCMRSENEVVVYCALDQEFSAPIFDAFTKETGINVRAKYDTEANKTVGLTNLIIAEKDRPRCDLFWNNEILNTLRLKAKGLLTTYASREAENYPAEYRDPDQQWFGFAARARVLLVNHEKLAKDKFPASIRDLVDPKWKDQVGIAKPLFGTTASHAACLFAVDGDDAAKIFFTQVRNNARIYAGNKQVARAVSSGQIAFGLTDTDDATIEIENGYPVSMVYPDQNNDQLGTLFIPNSLALIKGAANTGNAEKLVEFLLSPKTEAALANCRSAQIPLNKRTQIESRVYSPQTKRAMQIDFAQAETKWYTAAEFLKSVFMQN